jgi:hypothetical protein
MTEKTCEICSRTLPVTARYCRRCGYSLGPAVAHNSPAPVVPAKPAAATRRSGGGGGGGFFKLLLLGGLVWGRYHLAQPHTPSKFDPLQPVKAQPIAPMPKLSVAVPAVPAAPPLGSWHSTTRGPSLEELERMSREFEANSKKHAAATAER